MRCKRDDQQACRNFAERAVGQKLIDKAELNHEDEGALGAVGK